MEYTIRDFIDSLFEKIRAHLNLYLQQTEEKALRENELKITLGIYLCFNILMYFFVSWDIFLYWLCVNVFIGFMLKNIFFPSSFQKVNKFERRDQSAPATFFEGGLYKVPETIVEKKVQAPKRAEKKLNETFELTSEKPSPNRSFTSVRGTSLHPHKTQKSEEKKLVKILEEEPVITEDFDINTITKQIPDLKPGRRNLSAISEVLTESAMSEVEELQSAKIPKVEAGDDLMNSVFKEPRGRAIKADWIDDTPTVIELDETNSKPEVIIQPETSFFQLQASTSPFFAELAKNMSNNQTTTLDWGSSIKENKKRESESQGDIWNKVTIEKDEFVDKKENGPVRSLFTKRVITPPFETEGLEPQEDAKQGPSKEISYWNSTKPSANLFSEKKEVQSESLFANKNMNSFPAPKVFQKAESSEKNLNSETNRNNEALSSEKNEAQTENSFFNKSLNSFSAPKLFQTQNQDRESLDKSRTKETSNGEINKTTLAYIAEKKEAQIENSFSNKSLNSFQAPKMFQTQNRESLNQSITKETSTLESIRYSTLLPEKREPQMGNSFLNTSLNSSLRQRNLEGQENLNQSFRSDGSASKSITGKVSFKPHSTTARMHSLLAQNDDDE